MNEATKVVSRTIDKTSDDNVQYNQLQKIDSYVIFIFYGTRIWG